MTPPAVCVLLTFSSLLQDLQDEGDIVQVGSLGARWVLRQHADPWLLTINSRNWTQARLTSDPHPYLGNQHNIPFMRKRCRRDVQQDAMEPPAKKSDVDRQEDKDREDADRLKRSTEGKEEEDEPLKHGDEKDEGKTPLNLEESHQEEEEEKEKDNLEAEGRVERSRRHHRNSRDREMDQGPKEDTDLHEYVSPSGVISASVDEDSSPFFSHAGTVSSAGHGEWLMGM